MLQHDVITTTCLIVLYCIHKKKQGRQLNQVMTAALECNETKPSHLRKPSAVVLTNQNELVLLEQGAAATLHASKGDFSKSPCLCSFFLIDIQ